MSAPRVVSLLALGVVGTACSPAEPTAVCQEYVACRDALDNLNHSGTSAQDSYRDTGSCWTTMARANECTTYCRDHLAEIRRTAAQPLPAVCNAAHPSPAASYDPLPPEGACSAPRHLEAETAGVRTTRAIDVDADGDTDLVVLGRDEGLIVYRNDGTGRFTITHVMDSPDSIALDLVDVTGDGRLDALVYHQNAEAISVFAATAEGSFESTNFATGVPGNSVTYADFDGDSLVDAFVASVGVGGRALFARGDGHGAFGTPRAMTLEWPIDRPIAFDADEDGDLDVLVVTGDTRGLAIARNDGHANFTWSQVTETTLLTAQVAAVGDLDGDGHLDIAAMGVDHIAGDAPLIVTILFGDGTGNFAGEIVRTETFRPNGFAITDVDRDGHPDLVGGGASGFDVMPGLGNRMFGPIVTHALPMQVRDLAIADLDGDRMNDVVVGGLADSTRRESIEIVFACRGR